MKTSYGTVRYSRVNLCIKMVVIYQSFEELNREKIVFCLRGSNNFEFIDTATVDGSAQRLLNI